MMHGQKKSNSSLVFVNYCDIHPVVVYSIKIDVRAAFNPKQIFLILSIQATCCGRTDHPQAFKYMI